MVLLQERAMHIVECEIVGMDGTIQCCVTSLTLIL